MSTEIDVKIGNALKFDPLATAEKMTGLSYKDDDRTTLVGLTLAATHSREKDRLLQEQGDTQLTNDLQYYLGVLQAEGFEKVIEMPFEGKSWGEKTVSETLFVFWHRDGILLDFDTFCGDRVNGGKFYYNWRPFVNEGGELDRSTVWDVTSSGGMFDGANGEKIWSGHHDSREALRFNIRRLRQRGEFLPQWQEQPFLWLLHYMDTKDPAYSYDAINAARIAMLPEYVKVAILETSHAQSK